LRAELHPKIDQHIADKVRDGPAFFGGDAFDCLVLLGIKSDRICFDIGTSPTARRRNQNVTTAAKHRQ